MNAWAARVVVNGGAFPSNATLLALSAFQRGLIADALDTQMLSWNAIVPDNLIASITPQLVGPGFDPWTNTSFVGGDLTVNGLTGDASSKSLRTGFIPSTGYPSTISSGAVAYCYTASATGTTMASTNNVGYLELIGKFSDNNTYSRNGTISNLVQVASPGNGFYSAQRVGNNDHRIYFANSGNAHAQIGATDAAGSGGSASPVYVDVFRFNNLGLASSDTISFVAFTTGLSAVSSANLFNRIQTLRQALGGGYR
jgi:hypothetical protein